MELLFSTDSGQSATRQVRPKSVMPTTSQSQSCEVEDTEKHLVHVLFPEMENGLHVMELDSNELNDFKQRYKDKELLIMKSDLTMGDVCAGKTSCMQSLQNAISSSLVTPFFVPTETQSYTSSSPVDDRIAQLEARLELKNQQYIALDHMYVSTQTRLTAALKELQRQR